MTYHLNCEEPGLVVVRWGGGDPQTGEFVDGIATIEPGEDFDGVSYGDLKALGSGPREEEELRALAV